MHCIWFRHLSRGVWSKGGQERSLVPWAASCRGLHLEALPQPSQVSQGKAVRSWLVRQFWLHLSSLILGLLMFHPFQVQEELEFGIGTL